MHIALRAASSNAVAGQNAPSLQNLLTVALRFSTAPPIFLVLLFATSHNRNMSIVQPLPVNTAPPIHSIWRDVSQSTFRTRIDQLQRKTDVPGESKTHTYEAWRRQTGVPHESPHLLPSDVEERVVNDIAFIAANRKDVNSVSAVALEEQRSAHGLIVRLAANGAIEVLVINTLSSIFGLLQDCALKSGLPRRACRSSSFAHSRLTFPRAFARQM